ncbi:hypothetical protein SLS56_005344 [Neofusicoccum ribis]|uniref:Uncharacterized protein n=1 Tax=Neofusicoccum ribis TaxID=45134 RepID=A0ABR3STT6_9PEZI
MTTRRGEWAGQWTGTILDDGDDPSGVLQQEDQLNVQVERWNGTIEKREYAYPNSIAYILLSTTGVNANK